MRTGEPDPCGEPRAPKRNRYFTGKVLGARDLQDEQTYFLEKEILHARYLHGYGVVCGLRVRPTEPPQRWRLVVEPGLALDPCGREIVVPQAVEYGFGRLEQRGPIYLVIEYCEVEADPMPVPGPPEGPQDSIEASRVEETFRLDIRTEPGEGEDVPGRRLAAELANAIRSGAEPETTHNLLAEFVSRPCQLRRRDMAVTLARIDVPPEGPIAEVAIDNYSYRPVALSVGQALNMILEVIRQVRGSG
jgi:hypothetical protein